MIGDWVGVMTEMSGHDRLLIGRTILELVISAKHDSLQFGEPEMNCCGNGISREISLTRTINYE